MQALESALRMNEHRRAWVRRVVGGMLAGLCVVAIAATYAKVRVAGEPLLAAAQEAGRDLLLEPLGTVFLVAPFATLALLAPIFALRGSSSSRWWIVGGGAFALAAFYLNGFIGSEHALQQRKWTAAALSVGLMPVLSLFLMLGAAVVAVVVKGLDRNAA
jgi:hypothetical protein